MTTLDEMFPNLSGLVQRVLWMSLEELASRAPVVGVQFYDLERLLATVRANEASPLDALCTAIFGAHHAQDHGYLATIDAFIRLGAIRDEKAFVEKKLLAPRTPRTQHNSSEMMDTVVECSWGLWLNDEHGNIETERCFPDGSGDSDFYVDTRHGPLWVDCVSVGPKNPPTSVIGYLTKRASKKWHDKFGSRIAAATLPAAIAVMVLKGHRDDPEQLAISRMIASLVRDEITGVEYQAPPLLWTDCPGLQRVWFGTASWDARPQRPTIFVNWSRS